tara:strand:+ start:2275 stop:2655 length:381 start_codon:yes stop_codon:yes gene_type:complete
MDIRGQDMNIHDFINKWIRPEVKYNIFKYAACVPFKDELIDFFKYKKTQYVWCNYGGAIITVGGETYSYVNKTRTLWLKNIVSTRKYMTSLIQENNDGTVVYVADKKRAEHHIRSRVIATKPNYTY